MRSIKNNLTSSRKIDLTHLKCYLKPDRMDKQLYEDTGNLWQLYAWTIIAMIRTKHVS